MEPPAPHVRRPSRLPSSRKQFQYAIRKYLWISCLMACDLPCDPAVFSHFRRQLFGELAMSRDWKSGGGFRPARMSWDCRQQAWSSRPSSAEQPARPSRAPKVALPVGVAGGPHRPGRGGSAALAEGTVRRVFRSYVTSGPSRLTVAASAAAGDARLIPDFLWHGAEAYGFRGDVWTCGRVAGVIREEFDVSYSKSQVVAAAQATSDGPRRSRSPAPSSGTRRRSRGGGPSRGPP